MAGASAAVALLMVLAPMLSATTYTPAFKGVTGKFASNYLDGCATEKGSATFSMLTGVGGATSSATAKTCSGNLGPVNHYSDGSASYGTISGIKIVVPVTGTDNLTDTWSVMASSAGAWTHTGSCPVTPFSSNYVYNYGTVVYWYNNSGYSGYCSSDASAYGQVSTYLYDITGGTYYYPVYPTPQPFTFDNYASNYTSIGFTSYHDTTWSSGSGYSYSNGSYSNNYTYQSSYIGGVYCSGNTCPTSWSNISSGGTSWINGTTFNHLHKYVFVFEIYSSAYASVAGWPHAAATANMNMGSSGNSASLLKVVIV